MCTYTLYYMTGSLSSSRARELMMQSGLKFDLHVCDRHLMAALDRDLGISELPVLTYGRAWYIGLEDIARHLELREYYAPDTEEEKQKRGFLIGPVRGVDALARSRQEVYVARLEAKGWKMHWPCRDTEQEDESGGWNICAANRAAIRAADRVFIVWDENSRGSYFDLGMAFAFQKPITILEAPPEDPNVKKSFIKMMGRWELLLGKEASDGLD